MICYASDFIAARVSLGEMYMLGKFSKLWTSLVRVNDEKYSNLIDR